MPDEPSQDVSLAVSIVMKENACDPHAAAAIIRNRARALNVPFDEVATMIVRIHTDFINEGPDNLRDWLSR